MVSDPGKSRWMRACQFCDEPTRKLGSTANVFAVVPGGGVKPLASVRGLAALLLIVNAFDNGGC